MEHPVSLYNSLSRKKEAFKPINPPHVGLYVCGPTVYGDPHLGHARPYITFDLLRRYFKHLGYKVRYVRNITDVGHLLNDADEGEDKIAKKARLEELEPMEVVHFYTRRFHDAMHKLNNLPPDIEPSASGHIIEQIQVIEAIIKSGYAYETQGSVYFDVVKYNQDHPYGILSGRKVEELMANTRELAGQDEKNNPVDFALWKKAKPEHIMRWPSPWSDGFPGWHLECTAMSTKYLGNHFDIHGGGMDLQFPHHEAEIAQSVGSCGHQPCNFWMHNNLITIQGQKMGKSLGNFITLDELFSGNHEKLEQAYDPQTVRFYILQAHYRSTLDFSNDALKAAEKGLDRLRKSLKTLEDLEASQSSEIDLGSWKKKIYTALNDDLNSPIAISHLFEGVKWINQAHEGQLKISESDLKDLKAFMPLMVTDVLGLVAEPEENHGSDAGLDQGLMDLILNLRKQAKDNKDWTTADLIRDALSGMGIQVKDTKDGSTWEKN